MIRSLVIAVLFLISFGAQSSPKFSDSECVQIGGFYRTVAQMRDRGLTPQETLRFASGYPSKISASEVKQIINALYFDVGFMRAGGVNLQMQVYRLCIGKYKQINRLE